MGQSGQLADATWESRPTGSNYVVLTGKWVKKETAAFFTGRFNNKTIHPYQQLQDFILKPATRSALNASEYLDRVSRFKTDVFGVEEAIEVVL